MPTERFFRLPEEKRKRICQAAYEEMARVPYDNLSINQIIQRAGIPRGSFYQYFQDKEDMLAYMMSGFRECLMQSVRKAITESGGDLFYVYPEALKQIIAFGEQEEHYRIMKNLFAGLRVAEIKSFEIFKEINQEFIREIYPLVDLSGFRSDRIEDFMELAEFLGVLSRNAGIEIFSDISRKEAVLKKVERRLEVIKHGVLKKEEQESDV